ncbi:MAG TPA: di-trans,poly-cis-decaprenylcistransferase [Opitutae bacterium]|nr:di-trans,poly-cis-decaprenylcistransferase [Opitutae bacterium]
MDGNGRWASQRGLPRLEGHRRGAERLIEVVDAAIDHGVRCLTLFAFSAENWKRPAEEVGGLFKLGEWVLRLHLHRLSKRHVRFSTIGDITAMPEFIRIPLEEAVAASKDNTGFELVIALNYGSRQETVKAAKQLAADAVAGKINPDAIQWDDLANRLETHGLPDPDLIIRTSGESRLSNFLLLQAAYAEIVITPTYWPDFGAEAFGAALQEYAKRERRYGMTGEQIRPTTQQS